MRFSTAQLRAWGYAGPLPDDRPTPHGATPGNAERPQLGTRRGAAHTMAPAPAEPPVPGQRWVLSIPGWSPTLDNQLIYKPWWQARRRKRHDADVLAQAALACGVPRAIGRRRVSLAIRGRYATFPDDSAPLKATWDAMVHAGLLVDDSRRWLDFVWPPTFTRGPKQTVIEIEELGDPLPCP